MIYRGPKPGDNDEEHPPLTESYNGRDLQEEEIDVVSQAMQATRDRERALLNGLCK
jgi:hypothetical protein